jgi:hypothetical protein
MTCSATFFVAREHGQDLLIKQDYIKPEKTKEE